MTNSHKHSTSKSADFSRAPKGNTPCSNCEFAHDESQQHAAELMKRIRHQDKTSLSNYLAINAANEDAISAVRNSLIEQFCASITAMLDENSDNLAHSREARQNISKILRLESAIEIADQKKQSKS